MFWDRKKHFHLRPLHTTRIKSIYLSIIKPLTLNLQLSFFRTISISEQSDWATSALVI